MVYEEVPEIWNFRLGRGIPYKVVDDDSLTPSQSAMYHAFPDFKGSLKLQKVIKQFLTKDQYGNYDVDPYIKSKFGADSSIYKDLKQIANDKNALDNDIPDDFRMDRYNLKAAMRDKANDLETNLFLKYRKEFEKDPVLAKKFNKLRSKILNPGEDVNSYLPFHPLVNKPYALDRKYAANSPKLQGLLDILSSRKSTKSEKKNAFRLFQKEIRRIKTLKDPSKPTQFILNNPDSAHLDRIRGYKSR